MGWMVDGDQLPLEKGDWEATTSCFIELVATPVLLSLRYTLLGERDWRYGRILSLGVLGAVRNRSRNYT